MSKHDEQDLEAIYAAVQGFTQALMVKMQADPLEVAAVLASTAMSIYKTTLTDDDFNNIVDAISDSRSGVRPFPTSTPTDTIH